MTRAAKVKAVKINPNADLTVWCDAAVTGCNCFAFTKLCTCLLTLVIITENKYTHVKVDVFKSA